MLAGILAVLTFLPLLMLIVVSVERPVLAFHELFRYGEVFHVLALMLAILAMAWLAVRPSRLVLLGMLVCSPIAFTVTWWFVGSPPFERFGGNDGPGMFWLLFMGGTTLLLTLVYWLAAIFVGVDSWMTRH